MTPEQLEQIVNTLVEKLGPIGEHVWTAYVKQVYVNVLGSAIWLLAFVLGACACVWAARRAAKPNGGDEFDVYIAWCAAGFLLLLALVAFTFGVLQVINPEYHAIQMLLGR